MLCLFVWFKFTSTYHLPQSTGLITFGAMGDSFYEYLLKGHIISGSADERSLEAYRLAMNSTLRSERLFIPRLLPSSPFLPTHPTLLRTRPHAAS